MSLLTPDTCWRCGYYKRGEDGTCVSCQAEWPDDPQAARRAYEAKAGISLYENDGDTWTDNSDYAQALRATIPTRFAKKRAAIRLAEDRKL
jgi:predicted amidophosphoribosyltransferase